MKKTLLLLAPLAALTVACERPVDCTNEAIAALTLTLVDGSGALVEDATVTWTTADNDGTCDSFEAGVYACAWEVAGELQVTVEAEGYETEVLDYTIEEDECHPIGQTDEITLTDDLPD